MTEPLELVWMADGSAARAAAQPTFKPIFALAEASAPRAESEAPKLVGNESPAGERRDMAFVLSHAAPLDAEGVAAALTAAVRSDGKFAPPLVVVAGELRFAFDEVKALAAIVTTATPFLGGDPPLKEAVSAAKDFLALPEMPASPAVIEAFSTRIREAFGRVKRAVPQGYLEAQTDRALLEQRRYQMRVIDGSPHVRATIHGERGAMLVYLPKAASDHLPLYPRFPARVFAEVRAAVDQGEPFGFALGGLAVARGLPEAPPKKG